MTDTPTPYAQLDWDAQGQPHSRQFDDVYFAREDGLGETRHVFLDGNRLTERFSALPAGGRVVIGETGFGTGTNFLCAWQLFERCAPADAQLHFVSVEKYPLSPADLQRALALWPELAPWSGQLLDHYVAIHPGFQRLLLAGGRVVLTLLIGDALDMLPQLDGQIDVWFLDGFAPAKNLDMWSLPLFQQLARLSAPDASIATFASTGFVRRALIEAGFAMRRVPGYGTKWENLSGRYAGPPASADKPWFARAAYRPEHREALVIGAGLAGCATAASLAARGWQVTLLERHGAIAEEASGNPQGVLYLKLSAHGTALSQLIVSGFGHTRRLLQRLQAGADWAPCGVLQLAFDAKESERQARLAEAFPADLLHNLDQAQAEARAGIQLPAGGLFYPDAGWVHPPALCRLLAEHPQVRLLPHREALQLRRLDGEWQALDGEQLLASAPVVVLAGAADVTRFAAAAELPLKRIRGQISRLPQTPASAALACVVCAEGYVAPARQGEHTLGASFDFHSNDLTPTTAEHAGNLELLEEISADLAARLNTEQLDPALLQGRAAFRCTSPDYLPIVGPLADHAAFAEAYAVLSKDARQVPDVPCPWLDGLYVNSGHGSRGLITAPLCGELLAAWLDDEPLPVPRSVAEACHPNRFALRTLIRGKR
ncbi:bifunctional tRNA (5-methylaminomethyl-2-thiouridine)(34)-methyltransferase MnmD/FAD-dependent 5-carboxymethylaminomethyl-2-thiouridine(34) oxidoreductase MnmC [Aquipseudomonas ullengensis]|uniref:tRNA 5-methylaminomethyl-2-thiouridine biosynthesis bifunctional protein MnmC n=1 Tax=Aquipseudomonas ullengensis TaxID=2759166 RepID=A0A7W4QFY6_9GAMM|nr:bifunctional tRNA (5-methylaminomethyl-2-thiouridine)(34)-methyltransferase MnmD/FAD-dependent 5-carboxymethylaminomethyl-2-thiouridine(34) oxidoreductase MnmC [Pseudomonas ullengensis]MBB2497148.1 bifunctional tRNA (5-methylaminomethyl-2-thiouridine)(34)-methyltransferase MnmD/FAD-dependent 5-carboxymethylaminomethyl-2-thiouridine(34) oxidoreductase MnmC [Pseudomonas ullengensis]